ncbi:Hypothetical protein CINCED_3A013345 [Cinara cedri]|uniref:Uncharacterized protein n=1 Tax=Cinara cedri TaxID=506608 RepID=A0A5E4MS64_9HEMI|nr:Hypothetical protein CINCED_3A013345 [Cinara cedri]
MKFRCVYVLGVFFNFLNVGFGAAIVGQKICNCLPSIIKIPKISVPSAPEYRIVCTKTPGAQQYSPINCLCNCVNIRVTPAKDEYDWTAMTPIPEFCGDNMGPRLFGVLGSVFGPPANACNTGAVSSAGYPIVQEPPGPDGIDEPTDSAGTSCCGSLPADPVSLMLAQVEANRCRGSGVREDRLAFGPISVPKDALPPPSSSSDVNEEGLYALNTPIIELKTCKRFGQNAKLASDTDALLALEEDSQLSDDPGLTVNLPSYADVEYQTETLSCTPLIDGVLMPTATNPESKVVYDSNAMRCGSNVSSQCLCSSCSKCSCRKCSCEKCSCGKYTN